MDRFNKKPSALAASLQTVNKPVKAPSTTNRVRRKLLPDSSSGQSWAPSARATKLVNRAVKTRNSNEARIPGWFYIHSSYCHTAFCNCNALSLLLIYIFDLPRNNDLFDTNIKSNLYYLPNKKLG